MAERGRGQPGAPVRYPAAAWDLMEAARDRRGEPARRPVRGPGQPEPSALREVTLGPGDLHFGGWDTRIRTMLGSCVAITVWHPVALIGGMCHFLLPTRCESRAAGAASRSAEVALRPAGDPSRSAGVSNRPVGVPGRSTGVPSRPAGVPGRPVELLSGKYADEALTLMLDRMRAAGTAPIEYQVKMFGGGNQFPGSAAAGVDVPSRNIEAGLRLLAEQGISPVSTHLGGTGYRQLVLDVWSGDVWLRHVRRPVGKGS